MVGSTPVKAYGVTFSRSSVTIGQDWDGEWARITVSMPSTSGDALPFPVYVSFSMVWTPPGIGISFNPNPVIVFLTDTDYTTSMYGGAHGVAPGVYNLSVTLLYWTEQETARFTQQYDFQITVTAGTVSISLDKNQVTLKPGTLVSKQLATVTMEPHDLGGQQVYCTLSCSGQPSGVDIQFDPNPVGISEGAKTSVLKGTTEPSVRAGTYELTITGTLPNGAEESKKLSLSISTCMIATATFGSELSPEVQFLRNFRDRDVMQTFAGSSFMPVFNAWYYSFSPTVADAVTSHMVLRDVMKAILYPLMGALHLSSSVYFILGFNREVAVVAAGFVASSMIGFIYFWPVSVALSATKKRGMNRLRWSIVSVFLSALAIAIAEVASSSAIMKVASSMFVLSTVAFAVVVLAAVIRKAKFAHDESYVRN